MQIKLWLDENIRPHVDLHAHCAMQLKVIGAREVGALVVADGSRGAGLLAEIHRRLRAANSAFQYGNDASLCRERLIYGIKIVKRGARFDSRVRQIGGLRETKRLLAIKTKMRAEHVIRAEDAKKAAHGRRCFAIPGEIIEDKF